MLLAVIAPLLHGIIERLMRQTLAAGPITSAMRRRADGVFHHAKAVGQDFVELAG